MMKKHTDLRVGGAAQGGPGARRAVVSHARRLDRPLPPRALRRQGYPEGTAGEQIPLSARISAIADVYDALTTARPYKEAWSHERAMEEILGQRGRHFDPVLVEIFRDLNDKFADVRRQFPG